MAFLVYKTEIMDYINKLQTHYIEETDKLVIGWGLMESVYPTISILVTYLFIVYYGPKYMENRKPFNLKHVLLGYNVFQVIFSTYVTVELLISVTNARFGLMCQFFDKDYSDNEYVVRIARCHWLYFIAKLIELLDTIFFVLRKKNNQISILHVYHHVIMAFSWYFVVRFFVRYSTYLIPLLNSFVHILMYGYYCLSALGPQIQPYLWWKKYLTKIQMFQFVIIIIHTGANCLLPNCEFPFPVMLHCLFTTIVIATLFVAFYYFLYIYNCMTVDAFKKHFHKLTYVLPTQKARIYSSQPSPSIPYQNDIKTEIMDYINKLQTRYIEETDKQVIGWGLMESVYPTISILVTYLFIVYYGPKYMENRKPFNLKNVLFGYNVFQVIFSTYVTVELLISVTNARFGLMCQSFDKDYSDNEYVVRVARCHWLYFIAKLIELLDTIFFVLRKKNNQISILHVYHHVVMAFSWYFVVRFFVRYSTYLIPLLNSFVHILMYGYYCLSALGPQIQPYLWWKKYLTKIQIFQFVIIIIHTGAKCLLPNCKVPIPVLLHCLFTTVVIATLFGNFYYQTYIKQYKINNNIEKKRH